MEITAQLEDNKSEHIEMKQLWSLAALYASIVIGWIAYHRYQPKLLDQFNFTDFTFLLIIVQGIILVVTPPIAGKIGDRLRFKSGHRIPIITAGISFAAMIFMAVAFTLIANPNEIFKWVLPILIVLWLAAMSIFTSPALSTLELYTPVEKLPRAMAILTIVGNLVYSLEPVIVDLIDYLGAPLTFMVGGAAVFLAGYALKKNSMSLFDSNKNKPRVAMKLDTQRSNYLLIFVMGSTLGLATTMMFNFFPDILQENLSGLFGGLEGKWILVIVLVMTAVIALPVCNAVTNYGLTKSFWLSFILIIVSIVGILISSSPILIVAMLILFTVTFTSLSVSSLPLAIVKANYYEKVFCVGIFFSGVEFPESIIESILAY